MDVFMNSLNAVYAFIKDTFDNLTIWLKNLIASIFCTNSGTTPKKQSLMIKIISEDPETKSSNNPAIIQSQYSSIDDNQSDEDKPKSSIDETLSIHSLSSDEDLKETPSLPKEVIAETMTEPAKDQNTAHKAIQNKKTSSLSRLRPYR
jgi:hypothetical protein